METYTFELNDGVTREHVRFANRFGIELAGDLYLPANREGSLPAVVVGPPYGGVKEQGAGVYANEMAARGFAALAFDPPFMGESAGEPRYTSSPELFCESFSAAVDYLGVRPEVDRERIGAIGICGSGGFLIGAAAIDSRIKAVATSAMYDIAGTRAVFDDATRQGMVDMLSRQRWTDFEVGTPKVDHTFPPEPVEEVPEGLEGPAAEFFAYYGTKRGHSVNAPGGFTDTSLLAMIGFQTTTHIAEISPRPILFVTGDRAHSRMFSEGAYAQAAEPKELVVVEGAEHIDLYDRTDLIPFDKLETFFRGSLG